MFRLKELRESRHMSQQELGDLVGLSKSSIGYYEQGKHQPDLNTLETLARFFDVTVDYLLGLSPMRKFAFTETATDHRLSPASCRKTGYPYRIFADYYEMT